MVEICILALIGLPAAGKTSFCHWLFQQHFHSFDVIHICFDDFIPNIDNTEYKSENESNYKRQRLEVLRMLQALVQNLRSGKMSLVYLQNKSVPMKAACSNSKHTQKLVICDDNHYYRSMRQQLYKICRDQRLAYAQIFFNCELAVALARNGKRSGGARLADSVLEQMHTRFEPPAPNQHSWETNTLTLNAVQSVEAQALTIMEFLNSVFDYIPPLIVEQQPQTQPASMVHQLDLLLRQRIKQLLEQNIDKQAIAPILNAKRKNILQNFRHADHGLISETLADIFNKYVNLLYVE